ncbi:MAG: DUF1934 domain-containing protein [Clostridia bacterium]|nr:DUF1934 domain-containing protein [Oscillospiraceae bacterium]MDY5627969.1 DUF1934 domain-containing protein [Clostridia bacterium]
MEKKNVLINIKGIQRTADNENENVELVTEGVFYKKDAKYYLVYAESEVTGMEGTTTTVEIERDKVSIIRNGFINNQLLFIPNRKTTSYYDTQLGGFSVSVMSTDVDVDVSESGGEVRVDYKMDINDAFANETKISINIKEA